MEGTQLPWGAGGLHKGGRGEWMWAKSCSLPRFPIPRHEWGPLSVSGSSGSRRNTTDWGLPQETFVSLGSGARVQGQVQADSCLGCSGGLLMSRGRARRESSVPLRAPIPSDSDLVLVASLSLFFHFY